VRDVDAWLHRMTVMMIVVAVLVMTLGIARTYDHIPAWLAAMIVVGCVATAGVVLWLVADDERRRASHRRIRSITRNVSRNPR
jgi:heme A synthase